MPQHGEPKAVAEGRFLLDLYHGVAGGTPEERYERAVSFRETAIRLIVLDFHLAFIDMLTDHLARVLRGQSINEEQRDSAIIDLAGRLGVVDLNVYGELRALSKLRNDASHNWNLVESPHPGKRAPLHWHGARLTPQIVQEDFLPHGGPA